MEKLSFPKNIKTKILQTVLAISAMTALTACPGNKGGGDSPAPVVTSFCTTTCAGIAGPTQLLQSNSKGYDIQMSWQLIGDASILAATPPASNTYGNYIGPVLARGGVTVTNPVVNYGTAICNIPVGSYVFDTVGTVGSIRQGSFSIPVLQATGPVTFQFSVQNAVIGGYGQSIYAIITILSVNGASCGNMSTTVN